MSRWRGTIHWWTVLPDGRRITTAGRAGHGPLRYVAALNETDGKEWWWFGYFFDDEERAKKALEFQRGQRIARLEKRGLITPDVVGQLRHILLPGYFLAPRGR